MIFTGLIIKHLYRIILLYKTKITAHQKFGVLFIVIFAKIFSMLSILDSEFSALNTYIEDKNPSQIFILVDENTHQHCLPTLLGNLDTDIHFEIIEIESGEDAKNQTSSAQALNQHHIKIDTGIRQALEPSINYINNINNKHSITTPETSSNFKHAFLPAIPFQEIIPKSLSQKIKEKEKLREKKKKVSPTLIEKNILVGGKKNFPVILNEAKRSEESLHKAKYFNFTTSQLHNFSNHQLYDFTTS